MPNPMTQFCMRFDPYLEYYPGPGEEGADGIHDGEIKGLREDAPEDAREAFAAYLSRKKKMDAIGMKD